MIFEWDPNKNAKNLERHGISFEEASLIFEGPVLSQVDTRNDYGEERIVSIGLIRGVVAVVVVHTDRQGKTRLISARLANRNERSRYHGHFR
ncbi:BrnT family toxin [Siccirubricoccus phaeus]|uniref:BrnT family toxin n=1 Tax=Siccirubricoccus phaeus TaxID=2595053 RepID=UPI0011F2C7CB|nr:BrnT family toxin [Siccirubricoccus phaeus]